MYKCSADHYKVVSRVFKNPLSIQAINSHLRLTVATGNLYIGTLASNEYSLDAREYGGANASAYVSGLRIRFIPNTTNASGTLTIKIGSLASTALKKSDGTNFAVGELKTNCIYTFVYDATGATSFKQDSVLTSDEQEFDYYFYLCLTILGWIEKFISKDIFSKTYELLTNNFCHSKELKRSPLYSVSLFQYLVDAVWTDVDNTTYHLVTSDSYSKIVFIPNESFPSDYDLQDQNTKIQFTTKMFDTIQEVDSEIKQSMLMILASMNMFRGDGIMDFNTAPLIIDSQVPPAAKMLLQQYRIESIY